MKQVGGIFHIGQGALPLPLSACSREYMAWWRQWLARSVPVGELKQDEILKGAALKEVPVACR
jgi:hypothetical protein